MKELIEYLKDPYISVTIERQSLIEMSIALIMTGAILMLLNKALK